MTEMTVRQVQERLLEMLKSFDKVCSEHGLKYFLSGGTLLGAVRHKGFIPWDDDIDVMMPRKDYERLLEICGTYPDARFKFRSLKNDPAYARPYVQLTDESTVQTNELFFKGEDYGIFLDVFPIDGMPDTDAKMKRHFLYMRLLDALNKSAKRGKIPDGERLRVLKRVLGVLLKPFGARRFALAIDRFAARIDYDSAAERGVRVVFIHALRERMAASVFSEKVMLPFEDGVFPAPAGYDIYLTNLYGDYMTVPKEHENDDGGFTHLRRYTQSEERQ